MVAVFLVRHAAHDELGLVLSGRSDLPLNKAGTGQARRLARHLQAEAIDRIVSSPCLRARQTASIVARQKGLDVAMVEALNEIDFGRWTGRRFDELADEPLWRDWNAARASAAPPDGESMQAAVDRSVAHLETYRDAQGATLCVSHSDVIRGTVAHYLGLSLDNILRFDVDPASITRLDLYPGGDTRIAYLNRVFS